MTSNMPLHEQLALQSYDRCGNRRDDEAWLANAWESPLARVLVIAGTRVRPRDGRVDWQLTSEVGEGTRVLLGDTGEGTRWALLIDPAEAPGEKDEWVIMRMVLQHMADHHPDEIPLLFHAIGIAEWHWATRFCARCGHPVTATKAGHELTCTDCGRSEFPRTDPAVIMAITRGEPGSADEAVLLGRHPMWPAGRYSTLAGFVEPGESLADAVRREVHEETSVIVGEVTHFGDQPWPLPRSLMLGYFGRAIGDEVAVDGIEIEDARWFTRDEMLREATEGSLVLPGGVSISRALLEEWYGAPLPGQW